MDHSRLVRLSQSLAQLLRYGYGFPRIQGAHSDYRILKILTRHKFHGDVMSPMLLAEVIHPANIPVGDFSSEFQLVAESFKRAGIRRRFQVDELQGDLLVDLLIEDFVDIAHSAFSELLYHLVSSRESASRGQLFSGRAGGFYGFGLRNIRSFFRGLLFCPFLFCRFLLSRNFRNQFSPAFTAKMACCGVV